ncbi:hypothetical protein BDZ89DRAFT_1052812 [Hymenopellis radicata]|nr:hypothetical protein BDZ89DRAFT_1052812 [Hymenopellis radicata]
MWIDCLFGGPRPWPPPPPSLVNAKAATLRLQAGAVEKFYDFKSRAIGVIDYKLGFFSATISRELVYCHGKDFDMDGSTPADDYRRIHELPPLFALLRRARNSAREVPAASPPASQVYTSWPPGLPEEDMSLEDIAEVVVFWGGCAYRDTVDPTVYGEPKIDMNVLGRSIRSSLCSSDGVHEEYGELKDEFSEDEEVLGVPVGSDADEENSMDQVRSQTLDGIEVLNYLFRLISRVRCYITDTCEAGGEAGRYRWQNGGKRLTFIPSKAGCGGRYLFRTGETVERIIQIISLLTFRVDKALFAGMGTVDHLWRQGGKHAEDKHAGTRVRENEDKEDEQRDEEKGSTTTSYNVMSMMTLDSDVLAFTTMKSRSLGGGVWLGFRSATSIERGETLD